ncbi:MAG: polymer-forming cytoskeletal protein [Myxococcales bacterium]|nr:polymer-forming cytoskeletal protein [Myxococcales bacterium]
MTQAAQQESAVAEISTLLGRGSEFEGKLTFEGTVRIDGVLKGEVFSEDVLIVGEGARVEAEIDVGAIIIQGTVIGNIRAKRSIEVFAPGRVNGDVTTPSLQIEKGVVFEGRSFMESFHPTEKVKSGGPRTPPPKADAARPSDAAGPKPVK